ncbi:hypothetical protein [Pseudomonas kermanshahensis]|uniref:hypothetical protein n=1 Tax=Pseudomonas kermanshahensis TaxID=2745482 RepID=UPI0020939A4D|nr:hypothetical protein [Pseudomonas kermanshahensis]USS56991.1 hypothetical protein NG836_08865 [Pseudomonas kermanshahensis]
MNIDQDLERANRDAQTVMLLTVFASCAVTEPGFDKDKYLARIEDSLAKMEKAKKPFDPDLIQGARIVVQAIRDHGAENGKS